MIQLHGIKEICYIAKLQQCRNITVPVLQHFSGCVQSIHANMPGCVFYMVFVEDSGSLVGVHFPRVRNSSV